MPGVATALALILAWTVDPEKVRAAAEASSDAAEGASAARGEHAGTKPEAGDPTPKHLGFIVEDNLASPAVDPAHSRVDMYGYVSLVVAGMQVQEREIAELRAELEGARREMAACKGGTGK